MRVCLSFLVGVALASSAWAVPLPSSVTLKRSNLSLRGGQGSSLTRSASQQDLSKPNVKRPGPLTDSDVQKKIWSLSSQYKPADKTSIQKCVSVAVLCAPLLHKTAHVAAPARGRALAPMP